MPLVQLPVFSLKDDKEGLINNLEKMRKQLEYTLSSLDTSNLNSKYVSVVESGSNANGYYKKYSDGTMDCYQSIARPANLYSWSSTAVAGSTYYNVAMSWVFPASFLGGSLVTVLTSGDVPGAGPETHNAYGATETSCIIECGIFGLNPSGSSTNMYTSMLAKGIWR